MRKTLAFLGAASVCAFAALPVGSALADTTIGQTGPSDGQGCGGAVFADPNYVVPSGGGTITSFSFQSQASDNGGQLDFLVLRPAGGSNYTIVGKTGLQTLAGTGLETFAANIPAQSGDIIGFWTHIVSGCTIGNPTGNGGFSIFGTGSDPNVSDTAHFESPDFYQDLSESATLAPTTTPADLAAILVRDSAGKGPGHALSDKATAIQAAVNTGDKAAACAAITDYLGLVKAQTNKKLTQTQANQLRTDATRLATALGC